MAFACMNENLAHILLWTTLEDGIINLPWKEESGS